MWVLYSCRLNVSSFHPESLRFRRMSVRSGQVLSTLLVGMFYDQLRFIYSSLLHGHVVLIWKKSTIFVPKSFILFGICVRLWKFWPKFTLLYASKYYHEILLDWYRGAYSKYQLWISLSHIKLDILMVKYYFEVLANSVCKEISGM